MTPEQRKKALDRKMGFCQHYNGDALMSRGSLCKLGVDVRAFGDGFQNWPCIRGHERSDILKICPKWLRVTEAQANADIDAFLTQIEKMRLVGPSVEAWRNQVPKGTKGVIPCAACGGRLNLSKAPQNGHVHGRCETKGCVSWME